MSERKQLFFQDYFPKVAYTRSVAKMLAEVGLITEQEADEMSRNKNVKFNNGGWTQNKAKKNRAPRSALQMSVFEIATQNRFGLLQNQQGNC